MKIHESLGDKPREANSRKYTSRSAISKRPRFTSTKLSRSSNPSASSKTLSTTTPSPIRDECVQTARLRNAERRYSQARLVAHVRISGCHWPSHAVHPEICPPVATQKSSPVARQKSSPVPPAGNIGFTPVMTVHPAP